MDDIDATSLLEQNGRALQFVREQTPEICMEAVKQNGGALPFVLDKKLQDKLSAK